MSSSRVLFLCSFMGAAVWMSRLTISAVAPAIKDEFDLTYTQLGLPPMAALAFAAIGYALSGFLIHRVGTRYVLLTSIFVMLVSTLGTANASGIAALVAFQGLAGFSEGLFYVDALVILTDAFQPARIGRAFGVLESAINVGIVLSLTPGAAIAAELGWRAAYYFLTVVGVITLFLILILSTRPRQNYQQTNLRAILGDRAMAALFVPTALVFLCFWSFWAFVPTYLTDVLHTPLTISGAISSVSFLFAILAAFVGGLLADRVGPKKASVTVTAIYALSLVLFTGTNNLFAAALLLLIITFTQAFLVPVVFSYIPKRFPGIELGRAYGIMISVAYAAGAVGPVLVGRVADFFGFAIAFLVLAASVGLMGLILFSKL